MAANGLTMQGTAWGNGAFSSTANAGPDVTLSCVSCHNPHGNGLYRILRPLPDPATGTIVTVAPYATETSVTDAPLPSPGDVRNYTVIQVRGLLYASQVVQAATLGYVPATTPIAISTIALDDTITTSAAHELSVGDSVTIAGATSTPDINGSQTVLSVSAPTAFKLVGIDITVAGSGGTVSRDAIPGNYSATGGDYWHQVVPYNSTVSDSANTNHDAPNGQPLYFNGQINAWCSVCHSRYTQSTNFTQEYPPGTVVSSNGVPVPGSAEKAGNLRTRVCVFDLVGNCTYPTSG
jgi:cytochrome c553